MATVVHEKFRGSMTETRIADMVTKPYYDRVNKKKIFSRYY
jgi:hypothetical protein